jgi:hypothetical protein
MGELFSAVFEFAGIIGIIVVVGWIIIGIVIWGLFSILGVYVLRTIETATLDQERASMIVRQKLGTVLQFPQEVTHIS